MLPGLTFDRETVNIKWRRESKEQLCYTFLMLFSSLNFCLYNNLNLSFIYPLPIG